MRQLPLVAALALAGCAVPRFAVRVEHPGRVDFERDEAASERALGMPWDREYAVEVYRGELPEGLGLEGSRLVVAPTHAERYQLLATITSAHAMGATASYAASTWWYVTLHDRHSRGRDAFCKAQLPLRVLTLGIWSLVSPTSWPCQVVYPIDATENLRIHVQELKRAAAAVGANVVILTAVRDEIQVAGNHLSVQSYSVGAVEVRALAVLDRERRSPAP